MRAFAYGKDQYSCHRVKLHQHAAILDCNQIVCGPKNPQLLYMEFSLAGFPRRYWTDLVQSSLISIHTCINRPHIFATTLKKFLKCLFLSALRNRHISNDYDHVLLISLHADGIRLCCRWFIYTNCNFASSLPPMSWQQQPDWSIPEIFHLASLDKQDAWFPTLRKAV